MTTTDTQTEQAIHAAGADKAPRITPADIAANIVSEHYFTAEDGVHGQSGFTHGGDWVEDAPEPLSLLTFCVLILRNNFTVTGESAVASPENFNEQIGRDIARQNAVAKMYPLMGYELRTKLESRRVGAPCVCGPNECCDRPCDRNVNRGAA